MKHNEEFADFLPDHVNLNQSRIDVLEEHILAVTTYMKNNHDGFRKTDKQGSHALGTIIKPVKEDDEYDADLLAIMDKDGDKPATYVDDLFKTLQASDRYKDKLTKKNRSVTISYANDCHLDVVPCIQEGDKFYVCPRNRDDLEETDGTGFRDWFNDQNRITKGNLKRTVRLLKFLRDHKDNFEVPSVILTTLAGKAIRAQDEGSEKVSTMADTVATVLTRIDNYLKKHDKIPTIKNPGNPSLTLNTQWTASQYQNFRDRIRDYAKTARQARDEEDKGKSIAAWQRLFGDGFKPRNDSGGGRNSGGSGPSQRPPNNGATVTKSLDSRPATVVAPTLVQPRPQYGGAIGEAGTEVTVSRVISPSEIEDLASRHPALAYDPGANVITGKLRLQASYRGEGKGLLINAPRRENDKMYLEDDFDVEIQLTYEPNYLIPWPPVYETGGRAQRIMQERNVPKEDLHFFTTESGVNQCCLGLQNTDVWRGIIPFMDEIVTPFFYRLSYASRFGVARAESDLWRAYGHWGGFGFAATQYIAELMRYKKLKRGNNKPCPCGSGRKYRDCHKPECDAL